MRRIAIFYPTDPLGYGTGGIESIIRGILKWSPSDLNYTLFGATSDTASRPVGLEQTLPFGASRSRFIPVTTVDSAGGRGAVPLIVRYMHALRRRIRTGQCASFDILDFHRIEPLLLFMRDRRPKNIILHQDMSVIREKDCDILWRHAPWLYDLIERRILPTVDHVFAVRQSAVARYQQSYSRSNDWVSFLPTWVDVTTFMPAPSPEERNRLRAGLRRQLGIGAPDAQILVTVGRLDRQKDPLLLISAFREVLRVRKNLHLVMIGDGVLRPQVEHACAALRANGVISLLGVQPPLEIARILRSSDLFVLSSAYEGMPIAVLEALATGIPVVSTNVGEVPLVVQNGINGAICSQRTVAALTEAIISCLARLPAMTGAPCENAAAPYHPENVLHLIYANHRMQGGRLPDAVDPPSANRHRRGAIS